MPHTPLLRTTDISITWPASSNENWRRERFLNVAAKTASFTVWADDATGSPKDLYVITATAANVVATMPSATGTDGAAGRVVGFRAKDIGTGKTITLSPITGQTIQGGASVVMAEGEVRWYVADGTDWVLIGLKS